MILKGGEDIVAIYDCDQVANVKVGVKVAVQESEFYKAEKEKQQEILKEMFFNNETIQQDEERSQTLSRDASPSPINMRTPRDGVVSSKRNSIKTASLHNN